MTKMREKEKDEEKHKARERQTEEQRKREEEKESEKRKERDEEKVKYIKIASPLNIAEDGRGRSPLLVVAAGEHEGDCRWMRR